VRRARGRLHRCGALPARCVFMGDSAGAALCVTAAARLRDGDAETPDTAAAETVPVSSRPAAAAAAAAAAPELSALQRAAVHGSGSVLEWDTGAAEDATGTTGARFMEEGVSRADGFVERPGTEGMLDVDIGVAVRPRSYETYVVIYVVCRRIRQVKRPVASPSMSM